MVCPLFPPIPYGSGTMTMTQTFGLASDFTSGLAVADFDGNGFVDVVIAKTVHDSISRLGDPFSGNGIPLFLRNEGNVNHSITIALVGTTSNANGIGAKVEAKTSHITRTKVVFDGTGFASDNGPWLTFGLGSRDSVDLKVTWPSGLVEEFDDIDADQLVTLKEGSDSADDEDDDDDKKHDRENRDKR